MSSHKISLQAAILININIIAGAGIFINIANLTNNLGLYGGLLYGIIGCFMFPLIFTFAQLASMYPSGGFYSFAQPLHPFLGFISCWSYFFGKLASVALYLHVITLFLQKSMPTIFGNIGTLWINLSVLSCYILMNCQNLKTGVVIQKCFALAKTFPMLMLILLGIYHFDINIFDSYVFNQPYINFIIMLPSILYCFTGFEAACSVSRNIQDAAKNAPKAIFYSFFSVIFIYIAFQTLASMMLLPTTNSICDYSQAYNYLATLFPTSAFIQAKIATALSFLITFSVMGAAYGLLFSNSWNLYTLAQHGHTFAPKTIVTLNKHSIPIYAILVEGVICMLFLFITQGTANCACNVIPLQQISALGGTIMYTISSIAFLAVCKKFRLVGYLSLATCLGMITACVVSVLKYSLASLYLFIGMFIFGIVMYYIQSKTGTTKHTTSI